MTPPEKTTFKKPSLIKVIFLITSTNLTAKKKKNTYTIETQNVVLKIFVISFPIYELTILHNWIKLFKNEIGLLFHFETWNHSILLTLIQFHSFYHSLLFAVFRCNFCYSLSFVVTRYHSLSLAVPLAVILVPLDTRCHSLSLVVPLVVTRCITRLSFYKRS